MTRSERKKLKEELANLQKGPERTKDIAAERRAKYAEIVAEGRVERRMKVFRDESRKARR